MDYYHLLELRPSASTEEIRQAYRRLALKWHPDKNSSDPVYAATKFKELTYAYEVLSDGNRRRHYDAAMELDYGYGFNRGRGPPTPRRRASPSPARPRYSSRSPLSSDPRGYFNSAPLGNFRTPEEVFRSVLEDPLLGAPPAPPPSPSSNLPSLFSLDLFPKQLDPLYDLHRASGDSNRRGRGRGQLYQDLGMGHLTGRGEANETSSSTATFSNGKRFRTKTVIEKGMEITTVFENDVLQSTVVRRIGADLSFLDYM